MSKARADSPVVLFLGEATVVDPLVHALVDERMAASSQSLDFETFRYGERPLSGIEAALRQVGMFSTRRCIWLRGFVEAKRKGASADASAEEGGAAVDDEQDDDGGGSAELLALLEGGVPDGTLLVVSSPGLDARGRLSKWFAKHADVRDRRVQVEHTGQRRGKLSEQGLRAAVEQRLADLGVTRIAPGAVDEIVRRSGNVLGETMQEVDRVVLAQPDPAQLTVAGVRSTMRDLALGWVFDFTVALEARNLAGAENLIARLLAEGEAPLRLSALLASHFASLVAAPGLAAHARQRVPRGPGRLAAGLPARLARLFPAQGRGELRLRGTEAPARGGEAAGPRAEELAGRPAAAVLAAAAERLPRGCAPLRFSRPHGAGPH